MSRNPAPLFVVATLLGGTAMADVPDVAADIAPVHSLVARVMEGLGTPDLILPPGASPHEYSLRPSEAAALQDADIVIWTGEDLAPWMENAIDTLAGTASVTSLLQADGTSLLDFREGALFEAHEHGDAHAGDDHADEHAHDDKEHDAHAHKDEHDHEDASHDHADEHDHAEHAGDAHDHDAHDHAKADGHGDHGHGAHDPHAWLSPANAANWLILIAAELSSADPENASTYFANATAAQAELEDLSAEVSDILAPARDGSFIVFHDAYQYFEVDFNFPAAGAISLSDATDPSPARIAEIQTRVRDEGIDCVLAEPQFNPGLVETVLDGTGANTGVIDPLGAGLEPGPTLYTQLIRNMATTLADCL